MGSRTRTIGTRAQSAPVGLLLVFTVMIATTTAVVAIGSGSLAETQTQLDAARTENTMTQLDSEAAIVALGQSGVQQIDLTSLRATYEVRQSAGWMNLSYENLETGARTTVYNETMGAVVYEREDGTAIAYQGGGVWRTGRQSGAVMVAPPEFHYRNATLTLPLVSIRGEGKLRERAVLTHNNSTQYFPNESMDADYVNPLDDGKMTVRVQSQYYRAWGQYFEQRTDGEVTYDHPNNRVRLRLVSPIEKQTVTSATASLSASGSFIINGGTTSLCGTPVYTNSYNSSDTPDDYCDQAASGSLGDNGDVVYGEDVDISNGAGGDDIRGDIKSGGSVIVGNGGGKPDVYGNISFTDTCNPSESDCADRIVPASGGSVEQISGVESVSAINSVVQGAVDDLAATNDNGATGNVSSNELDYSNAGSGDTVELESGSYYLEEIDPSGGDEIILDTTGGDITIAVTENVEVPDNGKITVVGDGRVNLYVEGTGGNTNQLYLGKDARVTNAGDDAPQFRVYGQDNFTATIGSGSGGNPAKFVGVIYAPPGTGGSGSVTLDSGLVYGGLLTGTTTIETGNGGGIHYDEALQDEAVMTRDSSIVKVTYIHTSVNRINVTSG